MKKELDLSSMSNSMFQSERKTNGRRIDAMNAIDILEKAYERSSHIEIKEKNKTFIFLVFPESLQMRTQQLRVISLLIL